MAIKSIRADVGIGSANGTVFFGGTTALNLLGEVSASGAVPETWKRKLNAFLKLEDDKSLTLGGQTIIKNGFYVKAKNIVFKETEHGAKGPAYWEIAKNVAGIDKVELAGTIRTLLAFPDTPCDKPWVATLTAAMFLSEVARNPRSFAVNLMLLDLIEGGVKYGSAANKGLDFDKLLKFDSGKTKTYDYQDLSHTVGKDGEAGTLRGGKLPMSQLNAMAQYQSGVPEFAYKNDFEACAKQSKLNLKAPSDSGVGYHFSSPLLEKECTVVLRWLLAYFAKRPLEYITGFEKQATILKPVWGQAATPSTVDVPVKVPISLTAQRDHVRNPAWIDAETQDKRVSTLKDGVKAALNARQRGVASLL